MSQTHRPVLGFVDTTAGAFNTVLPLSTAATKGDEYVFLKTDATGTPANVVTQGGNYLRAVGTTGTSVALTTQGQTLRVVADGVGGWLELR